MLKIAEHEYRNSRFCDGISRRNFLNIGTLAAMGTAGGWSLPDLLKAEEAAGIKNNPKSVIMIYLVGGPPHQDNALRLFGAREEDVRVTFYRDHAGVRADATRRRVGDPATAERAVWIWRFAARKENERLTRERSHSRSGARIVKSFGSCSKRKKSRTEWRRLTCVRTAINQRRFWTRFRAGCCRWWRSTGI